MASNPIVPEDSKANISPYRIPKLIWSLVEEYFENKYKVAISDAYPTSRVERPTIVWRIFRRTPGGGKTGVAQARGASYKGVYDRDAEGNLAAIKQQHQKILLDFMVYGVNTQEVEDIAWDLENAVLETEGEIQKIFGGGFSLHFSEQIQDTSMSWRQQDDLVVRTVRFEVLFQINYSTTLIGLKSVVFTQLQGRELLTSQNFTRSSASTTFYIPVDSNKRVLSILVIYIVDGTRRMPLQMKVDYNVLPDANGIYYIEWIDDYGRTPNVGDTFYVDYEIAPLVTTRTLSKEIQ